MPDVSPALPGIAGSTAPPPDLTAFNAQLATARQNALTADQAFRNMQQAARALATLPPPALNVQPAVNATQTLIQSLGVATRTAQAARQALQQPLGFRVTGERELRTLAEGLVGLRQNILSTDAANRRLVGGMTESGVAAQRAGQGAAAWAAGLANIRAQTQGADAALASSTAGANRLRGGLLALATSATGVPPAIGSVVSGLLLMGAGSAVVLGVAAGVAVIAAAYNALTRSQREARQATDEFIRGQVEASRARNPFQEMLRQIEGVPGEIQGVTDRLRGLRSELSLLQQQQQASVIGDFGFAGFNARIAETQAAIRNAETALEESARSFAERVFTEVDRANTARLSAERSAIQDGLTLEQQGFRLREVQLRSAFEQEEITRQQFTQRRIALAREAAQAEIQAVRQEQASVLSVTPRTEEETTAQRARLEALSRAIQLREGELTIQERQIIAEAELAGAAVARVDAFAAALESVRTALQNLPVDRFRELIDAQRGAGRAALNLLPVQQSGIAEGFERARDAAGDLNDELTKAAASGNAFFRQAVRQAEDARTETERLRDSIIDVVDGLTDIGAAANRMGLIGDEAAQAIDDVERLGAAIGEVILSASTGNILGLVGAGINLIGGLFGGGPSEAEREGQRIQAQNTQALEALRDEVSGLTTSLVSLRAAEQAAGSITGVDVANARSIQQFQGPAAGAEFLNEKLEAFGVSLEELDRIAEANGLNLVADNGRLVAGAFEVPNEVLGIAIERLTTFDPRSFSEQQMLEEWRSRFAGTEQTPEEIFRQTVEALGNIPTAIDERFAGVDLGNEEAVRAVFQQLLDDFAAGRITAEELDELSKEGLFDLFRQGADYLDSFNEGVRQATLEMSNIPRGFRQAALSFQATDVGTGMRRIDLPLVNVTAAGGDGAALPTIVAKALEKIKPGTVTNTFHIDARDKTARELFDLITEEAERRSSAGGITFNVRAG